jgi:hypothetical protein
MSTHGYENEKPEKKSLLSRIVAGLILIIVAALALKVLIGFVIGIFWIIVVVAVVIAVGWAAKTLL